MKRVEQIDNLAEYVADGEHSDGGGTLYGLTLHLASDHKLLEDASIKSFIASCMFR